MDKYLAALLGLAVTAWLMTLPDVASTVVFGTLGLGFPLVFAATGLLYAACAAPLILLWKPGGTRRIVGAMLAAVIVALVALVPNHLGHRDAISEAESRFVSDHVTVDAHRPSTIEIRHLAKGEDWSTASRDWSMFGTACGTECHRLMTSGQVRWVRIVETARDGGHSTATRSFFRALRGRQCDVPGVTQDAGAVCVVDAVDPGDAAGLVVDFAAATKTEVPHPFDLASIVSQRVVVAQEHDGAASTERLRQTEVTVEAPARPTMLAPSFQGMHSGGIEFVRKAYTLHPMTLAGILGRLGYSLDPPTRVAPATAASGLAGPVDDAMTREMMSVLDLPGDAPFEGDRMATIFDWIAHARNVKLWTPDLLVVLRRFVRDRRVRRPTFFAGIFTRPDVAQALLPDVLDMIEIDGIGSDYTPCREAAYRFDVLEAGLLTPYARRIIALLGKSNDVRAILLPSVGRLGVDPLPYLTPLLADLSEPSPVMSYPRAIGACRAGAQWSADLVPALRRAYRDDTGAKYGDVVYRGLLLRALANLGDRPFVDHEIATSDRIDGEQLGSEIARAFRDEHPASWLCRT